ncbi:hypothetical protein [Nostoc phage A1]|nr:hypothetical protein [Nostoc phage A1]
MTRLTFAQVSEEFQSMGYELKREKKGYSCEVSNKFKNLKDAQEWLYNQVSSAKVEKSEIEENEELQSVIYVFGVRNCQEKHVEKIIETMKHDISEESVTINEDGTISALVYELDPDNGDNQSLYISEWVDKFPCIALVKTIY